MRRATRLSPYCRACGSNLLFPTAPKSGAVPVPYWARLQLVFISGVLVGLLTGLGVALFGNSL